MNDLSERLKKIEQQSMGSLRNKILDQASFSQGGQIDPHKMEQALNQWLERVEDQVNSVEEMVSAKVNQDELGLKLGTLESGLQEQMQFLTKMSEKVAE